MLGEPLAEVAPAGARGRSSTVEVERRGRRPLNDFLVLGDDAPGPVQRGRFSRRDFGFPGARWWGRPRGLLCRGALPRRRRWSLCGCLASASARGALARPRGSLGGGWGGRPSTWFSRARCRRSPSTLCRVLGGLLCCLPGPGLPGGGGRLLRRRAASSAAGSRAIARCPPRAGSSSLPFGHVLILSSASRLHLNRIKNAAPESGAVKTSSLP